MMSARIVQIAVSIAGLKCSDSGVIILGRSS